MARNPKSIKECTEETKNSVITLEENGKKMVFHNKSRKTVRKIQVDNCAVTEGKRCDWLVISDSDVEHFVELKGNDVIYACEQLSVSVTKLSLSPIQKAKYSFVIASRVIPAIRTTVQTRQRQFKDRFNCRLIVRNQQFEFEL